MNIKYLYVRNEYRNRDVTIVSDLFEQEGKKFVKCAWAFRNKKDKFVKREGRKIAMERLTSNDPNFSSTFEIEPKNVNFFNIAVETLRCIIENENTPKMYKKDLNEDMEYFYFNTQENKLKIRERWNSIGNKINLI